MSGFRSIEMIAEVIERGIQREEDRMASYEGRWTTVRVEVEEGIGWVTLESAGETQRDEPHTESRDARGAGDAGAR